MPRVNVGLKLKPKLRTNAAVSRVGISDVLSLGSG